jgi:hypothetical protein
LLELRQQADALGLTYVDLLTRRLAELQDHIFQALGEVSFDQFQTAEPAGYQFMTTLARPTVRISDFDLERAMLTICARATNVQPDNVVNPILARLPRATEWLLGLP